MTLGSLRRAVAGFSSRKESERLRITGRIVLVLALVAAAAYYVVEARPAQPAMDDLLPGYQRSEERQIGILMGHTGVIMLEWQAALERPGTQALIIAAVGALFSLYFFRAASVQEENERDAAPKNGP